MPGILDPKNVYILMVTIAWVGRSKAYPGPIESIGLVYIYPLIYHKNQPVM